MTSILINNDTIDNIETDQTLSQLAQELIQKRIDHENIIMDIIVDGQNYAYTDDMPLGQEKVSSFQSVSFQTVNSIDLAFEALDSCSSYIDNLSEKVVQLTQAYQASDFQTANRLFSEVIDTLDLFIQLVSKIYSTIKRHRPSIVDSTKGIQNLEIHLLSVLKALVPAKENHDYIMLCDLLEYELIDNLTQWKIKVIPNLKKLRNI